MKTSFLNTAPCWSETSSSNCVGSVAISNLTAIRTCTRIIYPSYISAYSLHVRIKLMVVSSIVFWMCPLRNLHHYAKLQVSYQKGGSRVFPGLREVKSTHTRRTLITWVLLPISCLQYDDRLIFTRRWTRTQQNIVFFTARHYRRSSRK
jgi:hypothetical protein